MKIIITGADFPSRLESAYQQRGYDSQSFARAVGITYQALLNIRRHGAKPTFDTFLAILDTLDVSADDLLGRKRHAGRRKPLRTPV